MLGNMLPCIGYRAPYHTWQDLLGYILQNFDKYKGEMKQIQTQMIEIQIQTRHAWYKYEYIYKWEKVQMHKQIQMRNETNTNI